MLRQIEKTLNTFLLKNNSIFKITIIPCTGMHALKPKYLHAALNTLFGHFWITVLMPDLKTETLV